MGPERTKHGQVLAMVTLLLLLTAACSTGSDTADSVVDTTAPDMAAEAPDGTDDEQNGDTAPRWGDEAEMECIAEHPTSVDLDGLDDLERRGGNAPADLLPVVEVILDCIADPAASPGVRSIAIHGLEAETRGLEVSPAEAECIVRKVIDNADDPALVLAGGGGESDLETMDAALADCLTEENLTIFDAAEGGPQEHGDDDRLDSMWDDCDAGDMRACDLLYFQAPIGSAYARHAETCGGGDPDGSTFCSEDTDVDDTWTLDPNGDAAQTLLADCEAGDLTACDLLFQIAPTDSALRDQAGTCAERVDSRARPDCRTLLD